MFAEWLNKSFNDHLFLLGCYWCLFGSCFWTSVLSGFFCYFLGYGFEAALGFTCASMSYLLFIFLSSIYKAVRSSTTIKIYFVSTTRWNRNCPILKYVWNMYRLYMMQTYRTYAIRETNFIMTQFLGMKNVGRRATATIILPCYAID